MREFRRLYLQFLSMVSSILGIGDFLGAILLAYIFGYPILLYEIWRGSDGPKTPIVVFLVFLFTLLLIVWRLGVVEVGAAIWADWRAGPRIFWRFGGLLGIYAVITVVFCFLRHPVVQPGDIPIIPCLLALLFAVWFIHDGSGWKKLAKSGLMVLIVLGLLGNLSEVQRKGAVIRQAVIMHQWPRFRDVFPGVSGKRTEYKILVVPGYYTQWLQRPSNADWFAADFPHEFHDMLLTDRVYVDGSRRDGVPAYVAEMKPVEQVRFYLKSNVKAKAPVTIWFIPNPDKDRENEFVPNVSKPISTTAVATARQ